MAWLISSRETVLILGLDFVGKSIFLYRLKLGDVVSSIPKISMNIETIIRSIQITMWVEETKSTTLESLFRKNASPYFVLDSNDRDRMNEARSELENRFVFLL